MHSSVNYGEGDAILGGPHARPPSMRRRNPMACLFCRKRKIKCELNSGQEVCDHCRLKSTKCTILSVAQEEALKALGYTDESLTSMSNTDLEALLRSLPLQQHSSTEHTESHLTAQLHHNYGPPPSPNHPLPSTGQDRNENLYRTYNHHDGNRAAPSPYNNSGHNHPASHTSTNPATIPISAPHAQSHAHHQSYTYPDYLNYTSPSPNHQMPYQIPAPGDAFVPHHTLGDRHQLQQLLPNIPAHSNAGQSQDHANYSGQADYPFQATQQPSQGQIAQYQYGSYPSTTAPGYTHGSWRC